MGGVIASNAAPDKNHLSTGTFSFSDLKNEADYSAKSIGASYHKYGNYDNMTKDEQDKVYNTKGLAPNLSMPVKGDASSTTKSAVATGTIDIRENPTQDISALSRDTANSLNELGKIFDKAKIEERQELAAVFGEEAFRLLHNMKDDGSGRKIAAHAIIGGLMSQITGAGFASGAIGAGLNEALIKALDGKDPGTAQLISAIIGAAAAKAIGGNAQAGASAAASGTKNNLLAWTKPFIKDKLKDLNRDILQNNQVYILSIEGGEVINGKIALMVDAHGDVYEIVGGGVGVSALPISASATIATVLVPNKGRDLNREEWHKTLSGFSLGFSADGGVGGGLSISPSGVAIAEAGISTNAGLSAGATHTKYIYTLD